MLKKILIADDNQDLRTIVKTLVDGYGYEVIEAQDGSEAVEKTIEHSPDLILMDLSMPLMDGVEATKIIRGMKEFAGIPIIALTAFGSSLLDETLQIGMNEVLAKPLDLENIPTVLNQYLY